ncbi:MAG TPA: LysE family translocator, partial [Dongiaceae bacterium]|nr:LysE family translocator [Dongiaceae bacterium]
LLASGVVLGLSIAAPLGPVNLALIQRGLSEGFRGAFLLGLGSTSADLIYILLAYAGADPLSRWAPVRIALFGAGAAVMAWLGVGAIRAALASPPAGETAVPASARRSAWMSGFTITIVNPMTIAFWLGILAANLASRTRASVPIEIAYIGALALGCLLWTTSVAGALHYGRRVAGGRALRVVSALAGVALLGFGVDFAWRAVRELI